MAKELEVLGVVVDLAETHSATILVKNKEGGPGNDSPATMGGVFYDGETKEMECFGETIPNALVRERQAGGAQNVISQAELLPVWVARDTWGNKLDNRRVFYMIGNDGARAALINMSSSSIVNKALLIGIANQEVATDSFPWFTRVPSKSNLAEGAVEERFLPA